MIDEIWKWDEQIKRLEKEVEVECLTNAGNVGSIFAKDLLVNALMNMKPPLPKI